MAADKQSKKKRTKPPMPPKPPIVITPSQKVCAILGKSKAPLTGAQIAKGTGLKQNQVYSICQSFSKKGVFEKDKIPRENPLYYAPIINQTMHRGNFELIRTLNTGLRKIIKKYELKDPRMEADLRKFFKTILRQYPQYHKNIVSGMERLIRTIKRVKTKDEALELLGLRPSYPEVCTWKSVT